LAEEEPCTKSSEAYPSAASAGEAPPPALVDPASRERFPMLALLRMDPSVRRTPKILTPRLGHVRELCPLWLQCEHRLIIPDVASAAAGAGAGRMRRRKGLGEEVGWEEKRSVVAMRGEERRGLTVEW
jgi:hypothetical protein